MLHAHDSVAIVGKRDEVFDVGEVKEITIDEHCPAGEAGEVRREEAGEGELRRLGGATLAPVEPSRAELRLSDRTDL